MSQFFYHMVMPTRSRTRAIGRALAGLAVVLSLFWFAGVARAQESAPQTPTAVTIVEPGWIQSAVHSATDPTAAHYNPQDGLLYFGRRPASGSGGSLSRINTDGSITSLATMDWPAAVFAGPAAA